VRSRRPLSFIFLARLVIKKVQWNFEASVAQRHHGNLRSWESTDMGKHGGWNSPDSSLAAILGIYTRLYNQTLPISVGPKSIPSSQAGEGEIVLAKG
jgi:hypothetical protein